MKKSEYIKEKIEILKTVKKLIRTRKSKGLCFAIKYCNIPHSYDIAEAHDIAEARRQLSNYIKEALNNHAWLEFWQYSNGFGYRTDAQLVKDRIAWVDWIIRELEKQE